VKLGEGARVDLRGFSLKGGHAAKFRQALRHLKKDHASFRVIDAPAVPGTMSELRRVSDDWLHMKAGAEKRFSLGFFSETYLSRFPVAVIERDGRIVAFANILACPDRVGLSVDLMRYTHDAPRDVIEALLIHVCLWGQQQGYQWFFLGMAPLAGVQRSPVASLWARVGEFLYEHGEAIYHFRGLRAF
jgi:phosphatidylglycerol lysyltransferase